MFLFNKILFNKLEPATFLFFLMSGGKCHWPPYGNQSGQHVQWTTYLFFESVFLNLLSSYGFNNVFYAGQRGNYLYTQQCFLICQSIWLADMSCYICMLPWYLILMPYNTIQVHKPQAETDGLKLFCFWPNVCSQYIDNIHN